MNCRIKEYTSQNDWTELKLWLNGRKNPENNITTQVDAIFNEVQTKGDDALVSYTQKFDCPTFTKNMLRVSAQDIEKSLTQVESADIEIFKEAIENIRAFHQKQVENSWITTQEDGTILGQMVTAIDRVGLYIPGGQEGKTPLISSILMNCIPAQVAGVKSICIISPPQKDGTINPYILAVAKLLNITEIYASGSAWAIAALGFGTETIAPCDLIAGPGNIYVATAKAKLIGSVGIDMIAGPSEILIVADKTANPAWLAADMLSQAEHDPLAAAILITTEKDLADKVQTELTKQLESLPRTDIASESLKNWGAIIVCKKLANAFELVNHIAPEHLELCIENPFEHLSKIRHAGAIFLGHHCPESIGDYFAGPNHVLPTMGTARFSSALSVQNFCKKSSIIATSKDYVQKNAHKIARMARLEGLEAHARCVEYRQNTKE